MGTISPEVRCRGDPALMPQAGPLRAIETEPGEQVVAGLSSFWAAPRLARQHESTIALIPLQY